MNRFYGFVWFTAPADSDPALTMTRSQRLSHLLKESDYRPLEERHETAGKMLNGLIKSLKEG
jgi:hypothetical protein